MKKFLLLPLAAMCAAGVSAADYLEVELDDFGPIHAGENITLTLYDVDGTAPYTYQWKNAAGDLLGSDETLTLTLDRPSVLTLTVTDSKGVSGTAYAEVDVYGLRETAGFEGLVEEGKTFWPGRVYDDPYASESKFYSGGFSFTNTFSPAMGNFCGGFMVSETTDRDFNGATYFEDQFNSAPGGAAEGKGFMVGYPSYARAEITILADEEGAELEGCDLTNNMYLYTSASSGDGFSSPFAKGDYHTVIFKGDNGKSVKFNLADFRDNDASKHFILDKWVHCDLSPLGKVKKITVSIESSNEYVPTYFCMDNLRYADSGSVGNIAADTDNTDAPAEYFDLQGRRVATPANGIFIERRGSSARKILIP